MKKRLRLESLRPPVGQMPVRDLTKQSIFPLASLGFASAAGYGAKTSNVAEMRKFLPSAMVPDGFGIPFYFYDEFMKFNGLYDTARAMIAEPLFATDSAYHEQSLKNLRDLYSD